jgi:hypothetical protein
MHACVQRAPAWPRLPARPRPSLQHRRQAVEAVYESQAMPGDHKVPGLEQGGAHYNM